MMCNNKIYEIQPEATTQRAGERAGNNTLEFQ